MPAALARSFSDPVATFLRNRKRSIESIIAVRRPRSAVLSVDRTGPRLVRRLTFVADDMFTKIDHLRRYLRGPYRGDQSKAGRIRAGTAIDARKSRACFS